MLTAEGLGKFEHELSECNENEFDFVNQVFMGMADVKDCFHRMCLKGDLMRWFCYPSGRARDFGLSGQTWDGLTLPPDQEVWPCAAALPMGWGWSLYLAEACILAVLGRVRELDGSILATDRWEPVVMGQNG